MDSFLVSLSEPPFSSTWQLRKCFGIAAPAEAMAKLKTHSLWWLNINFKIPMAFMEQNLKLHFTNLNWRTIRIIEFPWIPNVFKKENPVVLWQSSHLRHRLSIHVTSSNAIESFHSQVFIDSWRLSPVQSCEVWRTMVKYVRLYLAIEAILVTSWHPTLSSCFGSKHVYWKKLVVSFNNITLITSYSPLLNGAHHCFDFCFNTTVLCQKRIPQWRHQDVGKPEDLTTST